MSRSEKRPTQIKTKSKTAFRRKLEEIIEEDLDEQEADVLYLNQSEKPTDENKNTIDRGE